MERIITSQHNSPPDPIDDALAPFDDAIEEASMWLDGADIENEPQMRAVDNLTKQVKAARKAVMLAEESECRPLWDAHRAAKARFKPTLDDLDRIIKGLVGAVDGFKRRLAAEKEAAAREARRKAWQAAEDARRAAEAANIADLSAQREAAEKQAAFEAAQRAAKAAEADGVRGMRTFTVTHVLNHRDLAAWIWTNDREAMDAFAEEYARTRKLSLPGIVEQRAERRAV